MYFGIIKLFEFEDSCFRIRYMNVNEKLIKNCTAIKEQIKSNFKITSQHQSVDYNLKII